MNEDLKSTCKFIDNALKESGYISLQPLEELLSADLTEATLLVNMWIKEGIIIKSEIISN